MSMTTIQLAGKLLREYRVQLRATQKELAKEVLGSESKDTTISNWEAGRRSPDLAEVEKLAWALLPNRMEMRIGLIEVWRAARAVDGFAPQRVWSHNFPATGMPGWVWVRTAPANEVRVTQLRFSWGPFHTFISAPMTAGGVFVQAPISAPNPPVDVSFEEPNIMGWCEFGTGVFANSVASVLGIDYYEARGLVMKHVPVAPPLPEGDPDHERWIGETYELADDLKVTRQLIRPHLGALRPGEPSHQIVESQTLAVSLPQTSRTDEQGCVVTQLLMSGQQIQTIRGVRGMSRMTAAAKASDDQVLRRIYPRASPIQSSGEDDACEASEGGPAITDAQDGKSRRYEAMGWRWLEHLEREERIPAAEYALARLDTLYGTDGALGLTRTYRSEEYGASSDGRFQVKFPAFWVGPIWLQPHNVDPSAECTMEMVWDAWARKQLVRSGCLLMTRQAVTDSPPLTVTLPPGWALTAGTGRPPEALDINVGWYPASKKDLLRLVRTNFHMVWSTRKFLRKVAKLHPITPRR